MSSGGRPPSTDPGRSNAMVDMKLEVVVIPVSDVDRAKDFYKGLGWRLDADFATSADFRVVQVTPPGSPASVIFGTNVTTAEAGSVRDLQLVVTDIAAARAELVDAGVEVSEVFHDEGGVFHHGGTAGRVSGPAPDGASYGSFASFSDPDGNGWILQEVTTRLPGRVDGVTTYRSVEEVMHALERAAAAHGKHEEEIGEADPEWPAWYAQYMWDEQASTP
ncbi:catechol 2,3-dioxygenase-like lactoylglutathione lyase family enzyme [Marmoricola sp. URHA0025 HA25]